MKALCQSCFGSNKECMLDGFGQTICQKCKEKKVGQA